MSILTDRLGTGKGGPCPYDNATFRLQLERLPLKNSEFDLGGIWAVAVADADFTRVFHLKSALSHLAPMGYSIEEISAIAQQCLDTGVVWGDGDFAIVAHQGGML